MAFDASGTAHYSVYQHVEDGGAADASPMDERAEDDGRVDVGQVVGAALPLVSIRPQVVLREADIEGAEDGSEDPDGDELLDGLARRLQQRVAERVAQRQVAIDTDEQDRIDGHGAEHVVDDVPQVAQTLRHRPVPDRRVDRPHRHRHDADRHVGDRQRDDVEVAGRSQSGVSRHDDEDHHLAEEGDQRHDGSGHAVRHSADGDARVVIV